MFGIELGNSSALARDGELLTAGTGVGTGPQALAQKLGEVWPEGASREAWIACGPQLDAAAMGEILRVLRAAGIQVQGFVDSMAAVTGWQQLAGHSIAAQLDEQQLLISVVSNDGHATELQRTVRLPGGQTRLHDAWLRLAAQTLVKQTRFDPLHDRMHESALRSALPGLAAAAMRDGQGEYSIEVAGKLLTLTLSRDQLADVARPVLQPAAAALQALSASMPEAALLVDEYLAATPGGESLLEAARVSRAYLLPVGSAARAVSLLGPAPALASGAVQYLTRLPRSGEAGTPLPPLQPRDATGAMATHLIYRGRAIAIGSEALVIGREPASTHALRLPEGIAGLSRRHCTLRSERGRALLIDHSSHGTYVDGMRVRGRAFLTAGSVLRLGTPGIELQLVALDHTAGT